MYWSCSRACHVHWSSEKLCTGHVEEHAMYTGQVSKRQLLWRNPPQIWSCCCCWVSPDEGNTTASPSQICVWKPHKYKYMFGSLTNTNMYLEASHIQIYILKSTIYKYFEASQIHAQILCRIAYYVILPVMRWYPVGVTYRATMELLIIYFN